MYRTSFSSRVLAAIMSLLCLAGPALNPVFAATQKQSAANDLAPEHRITARATATLSGVLVEWTSGLDSDTLGFNIYRSMGGRTSKLNPDLVAGPAFIANPRNQFLAWFDPAGTNDSTYEVESLDLRGRPLLRVVADKTWSDALPAYRQAQLLSDLGDGLKPAQIANPEWRETETTNRFTPGVAGDLSAANLPGQWAIANQPALKIGIQRDGWYRITPAQMQSAGFDISKDPANLQLFTEGNEIAISVSRTSGGLSQSDFIEFWGQGLDTATTDTRVYWLVNGAQAGKRIAISGEVRTSTLSTASTPVDPSSQRSTTPWYGGHGRLGTPFDPTTIGPADTNRAAGANDTVGQVQAANETVTGGDATTSINLAAPTAVGDGARMPPTIPKTLPQGLGKPGNGVRVSSCDFVDRFGSYGKRVGSAKSGGTTRTEPLRRETVETKPPATISNRASRRPIHRRRSRAHRVRVRNHVIAVQSLVPAFIYSTEYKPRTVYYTAALNGDRENFFGPAISGVGKNVTLTTPNVERSANNPALLQVSFQGVSLGTHQVNVTVNGSLAGQVSWLDQAAMIQTLSIPNAWLIEGDNAISLAPVSPADTSLIDYVRISYSHSFHAENDSLQFTVKSTETASIDGFSTANVRVIDVTDPASVQLIHPVVETSGNAFAATVPGGNRGKARRLIAMPAAAVAQPAWVTVNQPSTLNNSANAADLVIISYKDFIPSLAPLVAQRQTQFKVSVVDVEDVFDEFSYGEHTPQAIRDFMSRARAAWSRQPSYLLLVGDASFDPRNYLGAGNFDYVPSKLVDTGTAGTATALETVSDDWLTDFDDNGIADISTGRIPVRTVAQANTVISKIVNYSPASTNNSALLVADTQGSYFFDFEAADDQIGSALPATMSIQKVYRRLQISDLAAKANIISGLNAGPAVAVYSGHGNVDIWGGSIFTNADAVALTNGTRLPFVVVMDCLNGYFADPSLASLAETLVEASNGGSVAAFASSGLTIPTGQHTMGLQMFQLLYGGSSVAVGDASRQAKMATTDLDVRRTWILFGDPTMKIR